MSWTGDPRRDIAEVMELLYRRGIVQVRGGNASIVDREEGLVYMSPSGVPRNLLSPEDIAVVDLETGRVLEGKPTSEWRMHLAVYKTVEEAKAIVHAHPRSLLASMKLGLEIDPSAMTEVSLQTRCIAGVPYQPPGTPELAREVSGVLARTRCNVLILENHGVLVWSPYTIYHALDLAEAIEDLAWITIHAHAP